MLRNEFLSIESQMKDTLSKTRARFRHAGDKGTAAENSFRQFLREYLPRRLAVGHGEIVDSGGNRSRQTDVVIISEDHPFTFTEDLPGLFFIEGVTGAGEVKSILTQENLEQSIQNSRQFKTLQLKPGDGTLVQSNTSDLNRFFKFPPWFLFAYESQMQLSKVCDRLMKEQRDDDAAAINLVDAVFVLGQGWVINFGDGKGAFQYCTPEGKSLMGWIWKQDKSALFQLMGWLSIVMPKMIRFEPILPEYMSMRRLSEQKNI